MYLVEYVQLRKGKKFNYCSGYYNKNEAMDFALKLNICNNIDSVMVSSLDISDADVIYENKKNG